MLLLEFRNYVAQYFLLPLATQDIRVGTQPAAKRYIRTYYCYFFHFDFPTSEELAGRVVFRHLHTEPSLEIFIKTVVLETIRIT